LGCGAFRWSWTGTQRGWKESCDASRLRRCGCGSASSRSYSRRACSRCGWDDVIWRAPRRSGSEWSRRGRAVLCLSRRAGYVCVAGYLDRGGRRDRVYRCRCLGAAARAGAVACRRRDRPWAGRAGGGAAGGGIFLHPVVVAVLPGTATRLADSLAVGAGVVAARLGWLVYVEHGGVMPADSTVGVTVAGSGTRP
jgi:hypothetical protein